MNLFPFTDLFPWLGKHFQTQASDFLRQYCYITSPLIIIAMGDLTCNIVAANFLHTNGLSGKVTSWVGVPKIVPWAHPDWVDDEAVVEAPDDTLSILLPNFHPGLFKHMGDSRLLNRLYHLCWQVSFLCTSQVMDVLHSESLPFSPVTGRRDFLNYVVNQCNQRMRESGLQQALDAAREQLFQSWQLLREEQTERNLRGAPYASPQAMENEPAIPTSSLGHEDENKAAWEAFMCRVPEGKYFAASMAREKQRQFAERAGEHPLAYLLRQNPPQDAADDSWMEDDDLVQVSLNQKMERRDPEDVSYSFYLSCKRAYSAAGDTRIRVLDGGLGLQDAGGSLLQIPRPGGASSVFMTPAEMDARPNGAALRRAWRRERDAIFGEPALEERFSLSSWSICVGPGLQPHVSYSIPVALNEGVVPLKRFLDDHFPQGGRLFLGDRNVSWPPDILRHLLWPSFKVHLYYRSRNHPYFNYWRDVALGRTKIRRLNQHFQMLREDTVIERRQVKALNERSPELGRKKYQGYWITFSVPLPGAQKDLYRI
ncbi:hypothetical protein Unana1_06094 [Umbelopsis nana]